MSDAARQRTETLFRLYLGLLAISLGLSAALAYRHIAAGDAGTPLAVEMPPPAAAHHYGPMINWGGAKR